MTRQYPTARILHLRRQGYRVDKIAQLTGATQGEVLAVIHGSRQTLPQYTPTEQEIYEEAAKLREKSPRSLQGYPLQTEVEVKRASLLGGERRGGVES